MGNKSEISIWKQKKRLASETEQLMLGWTKLSEQLVNRSKDEKGIIIAK